MYSSCGEWRKRKVRVEINDGGKLLVTYRAFAKRWSGEKTTARLAECLPHSSPNIFKGIEVVSLEFILLIYVLTRNPSKSYKKKKKSMYFQFQMYM